MRAYTGIGSRKTPLDIRELMRQIAFKLACSDWVLRSGAARGADSAFEEGALSSFHAVQPEIYLPEPGWNLRPNRAPYISKPLPAAYEIAAKYHPAWHNVKPEDRPLHARNAHQILGPNLNPIEASRFVICWTPDGAESAAETSRATGGTGQAIRIASAYGVSIFNLRNPDRVARFRRFLEAPPLSPQVDPARQPASPLPALQTRS